MSVTSAFDRREQAIAVLATFKANLTSIYFAHKDWDWDQGGAKSRAGNLNTLRHDHISDVSHQIAALVKMTIRLLRAPIISLSRHRFTARGRAESARVSSQMTALDTRIHVSIGILSKLVEELKDAGLPGNEASRIRQYFTAVVVSYEHLRSLKSYRTPQGIRTFARVFIMLTPIVMGPYYAYLAGTDDTTEGVGLPFTCFFSLLASMSMQGLFAIRVKMEDPFSDGAKKAVTDTIDLKEQFASLFYILRQTMINPAAIAAAPADVVEGVAVCRYDTPVCKEEEVDEDEEDEEEDEDEEEVEEEDEDDDDDDDDDDDEEEDPYVDTTFKPLR
jgi:hypothetical protein